MMHVDNLGFLLLLAKVTIRVIHIALIFFNTLLPILISAVLAFMFGMHRMFILEILFLSYVTWK